MKHQTQHIEINTFKAGQFRCGDDELVIEEPLEIVLSHVHGGVSQRLSLGITMRTPGQDFELVRGFLHAEGVTREAADILRMSHLGKDALQSGSSNVVLVNLAPHVSIDSKQFERRFPGTSACGVCGKASLEQLEVNGATPVLGDSFKTDEATILALPGAARQLQSVFAQTGGVHCAASFDSSGRIHCLREDIGRHNAVDKLIGTLIASFASDMPQSGLFVSSRASFELLQKAAMAGFPVFVAVGAPSSLAVELAKEFEITLVGFVREDRFNLYNRADRVRISR